MDNIQTFRLLSILVIMQGTVCFIRAFSLSCLFSGGERALVILTMNRIDMQIDLINSAALQHRRCHSTS